MIDLQLLTDRERHKKLLNIQKNGFFCEKIPVFFNDRLMEGLLRITYEHIKSRYLEILEKIVINITTSLTLFVTVFRSIWQTSIQLVSGSGARFIKRRNLRPALKTQKKKTPYGYLDCGRSLDLRQYLVGRKSRFIK